MAAIGCWCRSWADNELSGKAMLNSKRQPGSFGILRSQNLRTPPQDLTW